jgi:hypothetical protein
MKNRYGDEYWFDKIGENLYTIKGDLKHWRFGGREGQVKMDQSDLGFVDPSGGPFIGIGAVIEGRRVVQIDASGSDIVFKVD